MQTASSANQLSGTPQDGSRDSRVTDLRVWMLRNGLTFASMGKALGGITGNAVQQLLKQDRISVVRHKEFIDFGVPAHLLPPAQDVPRGRPPKR